MVAALGEDVAMNCAAARAGIVRSLELPYRLRSAVEGEPQSVLGYAAELRTRGFEGDTRLLRLADGALANLRVRTATFDWESHTVGWYVALPSADRATPVPADAAAKPPVRSTPAEELVRAGRLLERSLALAGWSRAKPTLYSARTSGHASGLEAIHDALEGLQSGRIDAAVVLGFDSLLDEKVLTWLQAANRLKCDDVPDGLQPGEGAVAVLLVASGDQSRGTPGAPQLRGVHLGSETRNLSTQESARGEGLSRVLSLARSDNSSALPFWVITDLNGEVHRASDWGHALVRLRAGGDAFASPVVWYSAASFGDTGAASGLIAICMSSQAWERGYAPSRCAVVASVSDGEARAALALTGPGERL
jgi:3-oxoacyl-[acyl-carrier-protein] synthase-1